MGSIYSNYTDNFRRALLRQFSLRQVFLRRRSLLPWPLQLRQSLLWDDHSYQLFLLQRSLLRQSLLHGHCFIMTMLLFLWIIIIDVWCFCQCINADMRRISKGLQGDLKMSIICGCYSNQYLDRLAGTRCGFCLLIHNKSRLVSGKFNIEIMCMSPCL